MIEPNNSLVYCRYGSRLRILQRTPVQHYGDTERTGSRDLSISRTSATVFRDDHVNGVRQQQLALLPFRERPTTQDVARMRNRQRRLNRIDASNHVMMLRRAGKCLEVLTTERQEHMPGRFTQSANGRLCINDIYPAIALDRTPRRSANRKQGCTGSCGCLRRVCRDRGRVGMRGIDQEMNRRSEEILRQSIDASEPPAPRRYGLIQWCSRAPRERHSHGNIISASEDRGELAPLRRTTQNQNVPSHGAH